MASLTGTGASLPPFITNRLVSALLYHVAPGSPALAPGAALPTALPSGDLKASSEGRQGVAWVWTLRMCLPFSLAPTRPACPPHPLRRPRAPAP